MCGVFWFVGVLVLRFGCEIPGVPSASFGWSPLASELWVARLCCPSISGTGPSFLGHTAVAPLTGYLAAASGGLDLGSGRGAGCGVRVAYVG